MGIGFHILIRLLLYQTIKKKEEEKIMEKMYVVVNDWDRSIECYGDLKECEDFIFEMESFTTQGYSIVPCDVIYPDSPDSLEDDVDENDHIDLFPDCEVDLEFN